MKLTPEQIAEIEKRANAATEGPWRGEGRFVTWQAHDDERGGPDPLSDYDGREPVCCEVEPNDREFIAASRTDIPALLAHIHEVERERDAAVQGLREELKIVNAKNSGRTHYAGCEENHTLCAVARRLDAALKSAGAEP